MSTLLNKSYLVKVSTKGEGVKKAPNSVYMVCTQALAYYIKDFMVKKDVHILLKKHFSII